VSCCSGHFTYNAYRHCSHEQSLCLSTVQRQLICDISGRSTVRWPHVTFLFPFQFVNLLKFMALNEDYKIQYHIQGVSGGIVYISGSGSMEYSD